MAFTGLYLWTLVTLFGMFPSVLVKAEETSAIRPLVRKQMTVKQRSMFYTSELIAKYSGRNKRMALPGVKDMLRNIGFTPEVRNNSLMRRVNSSEEPLKVIEDEKIQCFNIDGMLKSMGMDSKDSFKKREIMYLSAAIVQQLDMGCLSDRTRSKDHLHESETNVEMIKSRESEHDVKDNHHGHNHDSHHDHQRGPYHDSQHGNHHDSQHGNHHDSHRDHQGPHHDSHHGNHHDSHNDSRHDHQEPHHDSQHGNHHDSHNDNHHDHQGPHNHSQHGNHHDSHHDHQGPHHDSQHGNHHDSKSNNQHDSDHDKGDANHSNDSQHDTGKDNEFSLHYHFITIPPKVWGYSVLAVTIISLVGLASVAIIPIMTKVFYNSLINFLVAMAIGALTGDAILHLIPHALSGDNHDDPESCHANHHSHDNAGVAHTNHAHAIWKGMCSLGGIILFFVMERMITILPRRKKIETSATKRQNRESDNQSDSEKPVVGMKLSCHSDPDYQESEELMFTESGTVSISEPATLDENRAHSMSSHAYSHKHGQDFHAHSHAHFGEVPRSVAAIAWMVIVGDGVHNLSDGLALGAAFSNSITGGVSTSIAIFCHELPHEIGDFAVLLRAGMSVKQALVYNCVSSILCFFGMVIGVALGNIHQASLWIFACVAGIFIYISLVDMMPELMKTGGTKSDNGFCRLFLHVLGMAVGAGIMAVIAMYEHELMNLIDI